MCGYVLFVKNERQQLASANMLSIFILYFLFLVVCCTAGIVVAAGKSVRRRKYV